MRKLALRITVHSVKGRSLDQIAGLRTLATMLACFLLIGDSNQCVITISDFRSEGDAL